LLKKERGEEGSFLRLRIVLLLTVLISTLAIVSTTRPALAEVYGPRTPNFLIHVYLSPDVEFEALDAGEIDIVDWYLSKYWVDKWTGDPDIVMKSYSDIGIFEFDINNQRWPTGVTEPRAYDPATGTYKHYYGTSEWDDEAREFRKAIAYLTDKDGYITRILKGYGVRDDTFAPMPATAGWTDYEDLEAKGLIYPFDPEKAMDILDAAGFVPGTTDNPYKDPDNPRTWYIRIDPRTGEDLEPLEFWIRMDDPNRKAAGWELTDQLRRVGIPVNPHETERTVCFKNVMVLYDFHLYTGGWSLSPDVPDSFHFLFHSTQYWGGTETSYYGGTGWSANYDGFCHNGTAGGFAPEDSYDYWAHGAKYGTKLGDGKEPFTLDEVWDSGLKAQEIFAREVGAIPLWSSVAVKAYRAGWEGVINMEGYGIDNSWSFLNMEHETDDTIDWGFKSHVEGPNPISSEWVWDWMVIGLIYDSLLGRNPYNLAERFGWLAESWPTGVWTMPDGTEAMYTLITLREGATFHNGDPVEPQDVKFSLEFAKACGPGVAWGYSDFMNIEKIHTADEDPTLGPRQVKIYFNVKSYWALSWIWQPILNRRIWLTGPDGVQGTADDVYSANSKYGWGYTYGLTDYRQFTNRELVRYYEPWVSDVDEDGIYDYVEDGAGPWKFLSYAPAPPDPISTATSIALEAYTGSGYYLTQTFIRDYLADAFHYAGDVNRDWKVDSADGSAIDWSAPADDFKQTEAQVGTEEAYWDKDESGDVSVGDIKVAWDEPEGKRHLYTVEEGDPDIGTPYVLDRYPTGTGYDEYNPDCDINVRGGDGWIDASDKYVWGKNKGKEA
jgi:ABC-type transport system substrate-binding protein